MYIVGITFVFILLKQRRRGRHARARRVYCIGSNLIGFDDPSRSHACRLAFAAASHSALFTVPGNTPTRTRTRQYTSHTIHFIHVRASPRVAHRRVVVVVDRRRRTSKHIRHVGGVETHPTGGEKRAERADQLSSTRTARHRRRQLPRPRARDRAPLSRRSIDIDPIRSRDIVTIEPGGERVLCARSMCDIDRTRDPGDRIDGTPNVRIAACKRPRASGCLSRCRASEGDDDDGARRRRRRCASRVGFSVCASVCASQRETGGRTDD